MVTVPCNLCGADDTTVVAERDRYGLPTRIVQCRGCGLRYINPRQTADEYAAFYQHGYRPLLERWLKRPYPLSEIETDQWRYAADTTSALARWLEPYAGGSVLDVGGSTGVVGRMCRARWGMTVTVVDPSADELARARDCQTICGSAETVDLPTVDVALVCRTLDHLLDPLGVLRRLRACARLLVVDVNNVDGWPPDHRYKVDHPYAFTEQTLKAMVAAAGWTIQAQWRRRGPQYVGVVCRTEEAA